MGIDVTGTPGDGETTEAAADFSIVVSMRGRSAHLAVKGTVDDEARLTLEHLLERLPEADVTEVVIDLSEHEDAARVGRQLADTVADASTVDVTVAGAKSS